MRCPLLIAIPLLATTISCLRRAPETRALLARQPFCANAPSTLAGTASPPRPRPRKSTKTILWCAPASRTYIVLEMAALISTDAVVTLLDEAINFVLGHVDVWGDGNLPGGEFSWYAHGLGLVTWDSNNHQQTWGVLGAALEALEDYMRGAGYGRVSFTIMDGRNEVGKGSLGY